MKHPECRGTAGAKSADTVETTIPLAKAVIATNSKRNGGEGKANAGAGGNSFGKVKGGGSESERCRDAPKQESADRYALPPPVAFRLVLTFCLFLSFS